MNNIHTIHWGGCGHETTEDAGDFPAATLHRTIACLTCRNAELRAALAGLPQPDLIRQPVMLDANEIGIYHAPIYPIRSGTCGMCGRALAGPGHPSAGVCDNV